MMNKQEEEDGEKKWNVNAKNSANDGWITESGLNRW